MSQPIITERNYPVDTYQPITEQHRLYTEQAKVNAGKAIFNEKQFQTKPESAVTPTNNPAPVVPITTT